MGQGYLWGIFDRHPQHVTLGYFPCASGCRGSENDPRYCKCICRGVNHGILIYGRQVRPIPVPHGFDPRLALAQEPEYPALPQEPARLPEIKPKIQLSPVDRAVGHASKSIGRKIGHSLKVSLAGYSQDDLNNSIVSGLRKQFNQERVDSILQGSFAEFGYRNPDANRPELYELYESGYVDRAVENTGSAWVTGRPKIKRGR